MANYQYMMSADDVARELNCSKSHAYKLVKGCGRRRMEGDEIRDGTQFRYERL